MSVATEALKVAAGQIGVRETSRNGGPEVDAYLSLVGLPPGFAWCAAFVHWCFNVAAASLHVQNPCPRTAGALALWSKAPPVALRTAKLEDIHPGDVFVIDHGHGLGHVGFVEADNGDGTLTTVEGNTNPGGSREGDGVYRRTRRRAEINRGFLRFG
jgi:hypothetical protein